MSIRKLLCMLVLAMLPVFAVGCTGPAENGGTAPATGGGDQNTTNK